VEILSQPAVGTCTANLNGTVTYSHDNAVGDHLRVTADTLQGQ